MTKINDVVLMSEKDVKGTWKSCLNCDTPFDVPPSLINKKFCSQKCHYEYRRTKYDIVCPLCSSNDIVRAGYSYSITFVRQRFMCNICGHRFLLDRIETRKIGCEAIEYIIKGVYRHDEKIARNSRLVKLDKNRIAWVLYDRGIVRVEVLFGLFWEGIYDCF